jgi:hypothetical protein
VSKGKSPKDKETKKPKSTKSKKKDDLATPEWYRKSPSVGADIGTKNK